MKELRVTRIQAAPLISNVSLINLDPPTLLVKLQTPMSSVDSVELNGRAVSSFLFSPGTNSVLVEVDMDSSLRDVKILGVPKSKDGAYVTFRFEGAQSVLGTERLLQKIARLSQTKANSILGHPEVHGYVDLASADKSSHNTLIMHTFSHIRELIQAQQASELGTLPAERLVDLTVLGLLETPGSGYKVVLQVITGDGPLVRLLSWEAPVA